MVVLYHYTNTEGKAAIERCGMIKRSLHSKHRNDAMYGEGVYLTSLGPKTLTSVILGNNWDGLTIPQCMKEKTEWYFVFNTNEKELCDVEKVGSDRDIWILRGKDLRIARSAEWRQV